MSLSLLSLFIQFSNPFYCETQCALLPAINSEQGQEALVWSWFGHQYPALWLQARPPNLAKCVLFFFF